ncbi:GNAT family N-acetyltransferase [Streptosporangium subroseum]|uniref:GNAT family N-acetyltransferase n=1 Tax=Streptosporangium subroseum TaxID=106412 RepID=UPI00343CA0E6
MRDLVIREACTEDLLAVLGITDQGEPDGGPIRFASELEQQTWARMMRSEDLTVYLAEVDGEPVGTASQLVMPHVTYDCAPTAFIEAVVVAVEHRRKGIATALLRRLLDDARAAGCNKVQLLSHKRHATDGAHGLYTSSGFEAEAEGFRLYLQRVPAAVQAAKDLERSQTAPGR